MEVIEQESEVIKICRIYPLTTIYTQHYPVDDVFHRTGDNFDLLSQDHQTLLGFILWGP